MLTLNQQKYLDTVPAHKIAHVVAFDPGTHVAAQEITNEIKLAVPDAQVFYLGSSALGIAGENDLDMTVLAPEDFAASLEALTTLYGEPSKTNLDDGFAKWDFVRDGFPVELHLNDRMKPYFQEQLDTQKILETNAQARLEYERIKLACNGLPWKEYLRRKYEFWNEILAAA